MSSDSASSAANTLRTPRCARTVDAVGVVALIVIHGRRQIGTNAPCSPDSARRRRMRARPARRRRGGRDRRARARSSSADVGERPDVDDVHAQPGGRERLGVLPPVLLAVDHHDVRCAARRSRRRPGSFVPPTWRRCGCSQNRVHATTSTPQASSVSVADGTRLTTRTPALRDGSASRSRRFCASNSSGESVPRCIMPSSRSSCSARLAPPARRGLGRPDRG